MEMSSNTDNNPSGLFVIPNTSLIGNRKLLP